MTLEEYFAQDKYFSESQQEFIEISEMEYPHAFYANRKLIQEYPQEYPGSSLHLSFLFFLAPNYEDIQKMLKRYGVAAHRGTSAAVRRKLHHAARKINLRITTEKKDHWTVAKVKVDVKVRVKGR